jgi:hypothetical protein
MPVAVLVNVTKTPTWACYQDMAVPGEHDVSRGIVILSVMLIANPDAVASPPQDRSMNRVVSAIA